MRTVTETIEDYDERAVEFVRDDLLVFADEQMRTTSVSLTQVTLVLERARRAYEEAYR
ncbi:MAG: hypothetical protein ACMXYM_03420 [Candidatus Woesearchaeota archaeon]